MKLLLDQNLSRRLLRSIIEDFPESNHVVYLKMDRDDDLQIWAYAMKNQFTIVTKDKDFLQMSGLYGHPPKVIHRGIGNCSVDDLDALLIKHIGHIRAFEKHQTKSYLHLV